MSFDVSGSASPARSRCALLAVGLIAPVVLASPASAELGVVKDNRNDGGLKTMTVERGPVLKVVTRFSRASDLHKFRVTEAGRRQPTFVLTWRTDRPGNDITYVTVRQVRRTNANGPRRTCRVARVEFAGFNAGRASRKMTLSVPNSCLWIREGMDIPRFRVDQRSFDVSDGVRTQTDRLGYTRNLSR